MHRLCIVIYSFINYTINQSMLPKYIQINLKSALHLQTQNKLLIMGGPNYSEIISIYVQNVPTDHAEIWTIPHHQTQKTQFTYRMISTPFSKR